MIERQQSGTLPRTNHIVSHLANRWRSWFCLMAVRTKSGRTASRLVRTPQCAVRRSGVTMRVASTADSWDSCEVTELLVSVSLWPTRHNNS